MNNVSLIRHVCGGWNFGLSETPHLLAVVNLYYLRIIIYLMLLLLSVKFGTSSRRRVFDRWSLGSDRKSFGEERAIVKV